MEEVAELPQQTIDLLKQIEQYNAEYIKIIARRGLGDILRFGGGPGDPEVHFYSDNALREIDKNVVIIGDHDGPMKGKDWDKPQYWGELKELILNLQFKLILIDSGSLSWDGTKEKSLVANIIDTVKTNLSTNGYFIGVDNPDYFNKITQELNDEEKEKFNIYAAWINDSHEINDEELKRKIEKAAKILIQSNFCIIYTKNILKDLLVITDIDNLTAVWNLPEKNKHKCHEELQKETYKQYFKEYSVSFKTLLKKLLHDEYLS
jgi:hypothetical protein